MGDLLDCCSPLVRPRLSETEAAELERIFRALGSRHRVKVINMLAQAGREAVCVCDFQDALGLRQPAASYHLDQLVDAGLLEREQRGRFAFFRLRDGALERVAALLRPDAVTAA